jgi:hypothetical protein
MGLRIKSDSESQLMIHQEKKHPLRNAMPSKLLRKRKLANKKATIVFELVDESVEERNGKIASDLLSWLREEAVFIPWVKSVKDITIEG